MKAASYTFHTIGLIISVLWFLSFIGTDISAILSDTFSFEFRKVQEFVGTGIFLILFFVVQLLRHRTTKAFTWLMCQSHLNFFIFIFYFFAAVSFSDFASKILGAWHVALLLLVVWEYFRERRRLKRQAVETGQPAS